MPTAVSEWKAYADEKPVLGSRCLIALNGRKPSGPVIDCEYHTLASYEAEYGSLLFEVADEYANEPFFVETDDKDEWWNSHFVHHWAELYAPPPKPSAADGGLET